MGNSQNIDLSFLFQDITKADLRMPAEVKEYSAMAKEKLCTYMQNKYGVQFTLDDTALSSVIMPGMGLRVFLRVPGEARWRVSAYYIDDDGKEQFADNYAAFLLHDSLTAYLSAPIAQIFGVGSKAVMGPPRHEVLKKDIGAEPTLEEYLPCAIVSMSVYTQNDPSSHEENAQKLLQYLKEQGVEGTFTIYYVSPQVLEEIDPQNPMRYEHTNLPVLHKEYVYTEPNTDPLEDVDWDMVAEELGQGNAKNKEIQK